MAEESNKKNNRLIYYSQIFAGVGIGMLMGLIIGLSASPVVKSILGTLAGLLGVFLGLQESIFGKKENQTHELSPVILSSLRAGGFGVSCALMIILGLYLRANDALGMTVTEQVKRWTDAGYEKSLALDIALLEKMNLTSKEISQLHENSSNSSLNEGDSTSVAKPRVPGIAATVLFSKEDLTEIASALSPVGYADDAPLTLQEYKKIGFKEFEQFAVAIETHIQNEKDQIDFMYLASDLSVLLSTDDKKYDYLSKALYSYEGIVEKSSQVSFLKELKTFLDEKVEPEGWDVLLSALAAVIYELDLTE